MRADRPADEPLTVAFASDRPTVASDLTAVSNDASVTYEWWINGQRVSNVSGRTLPKTLFARFDSISVEVAFEAQRARAETTIYNSLPRALEVSLGRPLDALHQGMDLTAFPRGVDADGDEISWAYQWIRNGEPMPLEASAVLGGDRYTRGDRITVRVTPSDGEGTGDAYTPQPVVIGNGSPLFLSRPPAHAGGAEYVYLAQATDPDGDPLLYRLVTGPSGMTIDSDNGAIQWPLIGVAPGRQPIEIEVQDGQGGRTVQSFELDIAPPEGA